MALRAKDLQLEDLHKPPAAACDCTAMYIYIYINININNNININVNIYGNHKTGTNKVIFWAGFR